MVVHWVPCQLTADEHNAVKHLIRASDTECLAGGELSRYELVEHGNVVATTHADNLPDAVVQFARASTNEHPPTPLPVVQSVKSAILNDLACNCTTPTCQSLNCVQNSVNQGMAYVTAYTAMRGVPTTLTVRTPSHRVHHLALAFTPTPHPTLEDIRHGVLGRLHVTRA